MATTANKIEQALSILNGHDWYWCMSSSNNAYFKACGSMRTFVELVASIDNSIIVKALRDLWKATYEYVHATMYSSNDSAKAKFKAMEAELMAIINQSNVMAA